MHVAFYWNDLLSSVDIAGPKFNLPYPQHQTFSWTIGIDKDRTYRERSHMRFIIDDVGRPLTSAKSTREVVSALRDAVKGTVSLSSVDWIVKLNASQRIS